MKHRRIYKFLLAATLCVSPFSLIAANAEVASEAAVKEKKADSEIVAARKADLETLYQNLKSKHPNIYTKNKAAVFKQKLAEAESHLETMSDFDFAITVAELTALVGDSHTKAMVSSTIGKSAHYLPIDVVRVKEGLMITAIPSEHKQALGGILTAINGVSMDEIKQKLTPMLNSDNPVYLDGQFSAYFYVYEFLAHYGIVQSMDSISLEIKLGERVETIKVNAVDIKAMKKINMALVERSIPDTAWDRSKNYFYKLLDDKTIYIQYNQCEEDKNLPMADFAEQVKKELSQKSYRRVIIDLRYNGGGRESTIWPLIQVLGEKHEKDGIQIYTLIGTGTFSSAVINTVMLKQCGSVMVGTPTGGSVNHFGAVDSFELPNSKINIRYSTKFCDLTGYFDAAKPYGIEAFKPDIMAEETREDYLAGKDTALQAILSNAQK